MRLLPLLFSVCAAYSRAQAPAPRISGIIVSQIPGTDQVSVGWIIEPAHYRPVRYEVQRDGRVVWAGQALDYVDRGVPAGEHVYRVTAAIPGPDPLEDEYVLSKSLPIDVMPTCPQAPLLILDNPTVQWGAKGWLISLNLTGLVLQGDGCSISEASFQLTDELGKSRTGPLVVDGRYFRATVNVDVGPEQIRIKPQKVKKTFRVSATATNQAGSRTTRPVDLVFRQRVG